MNLIGRLLKVSSANPETGVVHARVQDGRTAWFPVATDALPDVGDVYLVDEDGDPQPAPSEIWPAANSVGVVRHVLSDGTAVIDTFLGVITLQNSLGDDLKVNNSVEYNDVEGVLRIVSETPIRSRDHSLDEAEILSEYLVRRSEEGLRFEDFGGYPQVVSRARELIETQFNRRELLEQIGAKPVKGVLFTGPPGTGKTHLARIIAQESDADFFLVSGPSIVSKWVGDTESTLRRLFQAATASEKGRAIIFFDEIDSIAERRSASSHEASNRLVAQLLTLMDGFDDKGKSVVVIAATNRIEVLDPALTRPGRFDWEIQFGIPSLSDRLEILYVGARHLRTRGQLPLEDLAILTEGWSAAELTSLWVEAALLAAGDQRGAICGEDLALALERVRDRPRRTPQPGGGA